MKQKNTANIVVRESITQALLLLMEKKDFDQISISELTVKAGVGRVSFYRNYHSKEEVIYQLLASLSSDWWDAFQQEKDPNVPFWLFKLLDELKPTIILLYKSKASYVFHEHVKCVCGPKPEHSNYEAYSRAIIAGSFLAWADEWIHRGMQETPEEILEMFSHNIP